MQRAVLSAAVNFPGLVGNARLLGASQPSKTSHYAIDMHLVAAATGKNRFYLHERRHCSCSSIHAGLGESKKATQGLGSMGVFVSGCSEAELQ